MIGELARGVEAILRGRKFPVRVEVAPRLETEAAHYAITLDLDRVKGDDVKPPEGTRSNPPVHWARGVGLAAIVLGASPLAGARPEDHIRAVDALVDAFLVALREWGVGASFAIAVSEVRALSPEERGGGERPRGEAYVVRFLARRHVVAVDYSGAGEDTATVASVATSSRVSLDGTTFEEID